LKIKRLVLIFFIFLIYVLFFTNAEYIKTSVFDSIIFCGKILIPSVFPFIFISLFTINTGIIDFVIPKCFFKALSKLGICKKYTSSVIAGSISGYVTGAKCICSLADKNSSNNSFTYSVILSSNAGIGFVISCVGVLIWNDIFFGLFLYIAQILIAIFLGVIIFPSVNVDNNIYLPPKKRVTEALINSVNGTASSVISISFFIIAFSLLCDTLSILIPSPFCSIVYSISELCKGAFKCMEISNIYLKSFFTGFCIGFGSICVHFQIFSVCEDFNLNKTLFTVFKLIQGILLGIASIAYTGVFYEHKPLVLLFGATLFLAIFLVTNVFNKKEKRNIIS